MPTRAVLSATAFLALATGIGIARGDSDSKAKPDRIEALIQQLGDRKYAIREAASKELEMLGKPAFRALRRAAATSKDPEVRRRAEQTMTAIAARVPGLVQQAEEIHRIGWAG